MENLIFGFKEKETEYSFENKVFVVSDKALIENISKPNIKNQNSSLVIKSLNDLPVFDVVQIKVNVAETGHFLVSFNKETFNEEQRTELLKEIGTLKSDETPTVDSQFKKIQDLLGILVKYQPIYATFANTGTIKIEQLKLEQIEVSFPLLVLNLPKKKFSIMVGRTKKEKAPREEKKNDTQPKEKEVVNYEPFDLFSVEYLFIFLFSLLGSFAVAAAVFELMNKKGIAAFLIVLATVFAITLVIAVRAAVYKKTKLKNPWLRYYLVIFIVLGIAAGIVSSYFICKGVLKTEIENFEYKKMMLISIPIAVVTMLSSIETSRIINIFFKKRAERKE